MKRTRGGSAEWGRDTMLDTVQAGGTLLLLSLPTVGLALALPPLVASGSLVGSTLLVLRHTGSRADPRVSLQLRGPVPAAAPWIVLRSAVTAVLAPPLALPNHRIRRGYSDPPEITARLLDARGGRVSFAVLSLIVPPLIEELVLCGWFLRRLTRRSGAAGENPTSGPMRSGYGRSLQGSILP